MPTKTNLRRAAAKTAAGPRCPIWPLAALLVLVMLGACAQPPPPRKRSFVGTTEGARQELEGPVGLNPLAFLRVCAAGEAPVQEGPRVLVARPDFFTRPASEMIVDLFQALENAGKGLEPPEVLVSAAPLESRQEALSEGRRCGAMVVLWEKRQSQTLELALPKPDRIPLRGLVHRKLCEFGDHAEQVTILYLTILGLTATARDDFERANLFLTSASRLDARCLHFPPGLKKEPPAPPAKRRP